MTGGRIVGTVVLKVEGHAAYVQDLHSTKGWKAPNWVGVRNFGGTPVIGAFHKVARRTVEPTPEEGRLMRGRMSHGGCKVDLMRHSWYRRQLAKWERAAL